MHELLREIESITACRDRESLAAHLLTAVRALLGDGQVALLDIESRRDPVRHRGYAEITADGVRFLRTDDALAGFALATPVALIERAVRGSEAVLDETEERFYCVFPLPAMTMSAASGCLAIAAGRAATAEEIESLSWFVRIYANYVGLLDYSEFDTLTGLLNRKTFDDAFERLLAKTQDEHSASSVERRRDSPSDWWMAVVDIDFFKRVNDNFGHLFGDEVLLRVANLMRESFRGYDLLFRFGGEEFVVMLHTATEEGAEVALDRFRQAVEKHVFPQVGQVTCSIGYTVVDPMSAQTDLLGQADAALYWCKENGRNRIGGYGRLVSGGQLKSTTVEAVQPDIDIDALFG